MYQTMKNLRPVTLRETFQAWASAQGSGHLPPPLEIGTKNQNFLENCKSAA